jgi:hypothetical protein
MARSLPVTPQWQVSVCTPLNVVVGILVVTQLKVWTTIGIAVFISASPHFVQTLVSVPVAVQVAGIVTDHSPQAWMQVVVPLSSPPQAVSDRAMTSPIKTAILNNFALFFIEKPPYKYLKPSYGKLFSKKRSM